MSLSSTPRQSNSAITAQGRNQDGVHWSWSAKKRNKNHALPSHKWLSGEGINIILSSISTHAGQSTSVRDHLDPQVLAHLGLPFLATPMTRGTPCLKTAQKCTNRAQALPPSCNPKQQHLFRHHRCMLRQGDMDAVGRCIALHHPMLFPHSFANRLCHLLPAICPRFPSAVLSHQNPERWRRTSFLGEDKPPGL